MNSGSESRYVVLRGGLAIPLEPMLLLLDLEAQGFTVARDGDALVVRPSQQLTGDAIASLKRWKPHLLALVEYRPEAVQ